MRIIILAVVVVLGTIPAWAQNAPTPEGFCYSAPDGGWRNPLVFHIRYNGDLVPVRVWHADTAALPTAGHTTMPVAWTRNGQSTELYICFVSAQEIEQVRTRPADYWWGFIGGGAQVMRTLTMTEAAAGTSAALAAETEAAAAFIEACELASLGPIEAEAAAPATVMAPEVLATAPALAIASAITWGLDQTVTPWLADLRVDRIADVDINDVFRACYRNGGAHYRRFEGLPVFFLDELIEYGIDPEDMSELDQDCGCQEEPVVGYHMANWSPIDFANHCWGLAVTTYPNGQVGNVFLYHLSYFEVLRVDWHNGDPVHFHWLAPNMTGMCFDYRAVMPTLKYNYGAVIPKWKNHTPGTPEFAATHVFLTRPEWATVKNLMGTRAGIPIR